MTLSGCLSLTCIVFNQQCVCFVQMLPDQLGFAIVDEADSILIDESRNPMIISQPRGDNGQLVITVDKVREGDEGGGRRMREGVRDTGLAVGHTPQQDESL